MPARSLQSVLTDGEIVQFRDKQAYFLSGYLVFGDKQYTSPSAFANEVSSGSVNGWLHCKVMRDGSWRRLNELPIVAWTLTSAAQLLPPLPLPSFSKLPADPLKSSTDKDVEMPPRIRRAIPVVAPPPPTKSLTVSMMEAAEPPLPVHCMIRIPVRSHEVGGKSYWRHTAKEKLFQKLTNGGVGAYVGRLAGDRIDTSIPDSDHEV